MFIAVCCCVRNNITDAVEDLRLRKRVPVEVIFAQQLSCQSVRYQVSLKSVQQFRRWTQHINEPYITPLADPSGRAV
jgi:hypothetical protein